MPQFVTSVKTSMSREEAFDYMTDLRNLPEWDPGVSSAEKIGAGEIEKGSASSRCGLCRLQDAA